jgi:DNA-binding NarL/FixJ family response regulator
MKPPTPNKEYNTERRVIKGLKNYEFQTEEICLAAVKQNGWALYYVKEQTPELCLEAVKEHARALEYVKEQTFEIVWEAYKQSKYSLDYAKPEFKKMVERKLKIDRLLGYE